MNIGIIGCGTIGSKIIEEADKMNEIDKIYILDHSFASVENISSKCNNVVPARSIDDFINDVNLVIEAASQEVVKVFAEKIIENGKHFMIMSVGGLVNPIFYNKLKNLAKEKKCNIIIPSGAVCGIDGINSASGKIKEVTLITMKPPKSFENVAYLKKLGLDLKLIDKPTIIYEGFAKDVVQIFPKNINVAATVSLAGIGFEKTKVKIIADPEIKRISHKIIVKGEFGEFETTVKNFPSPTNPQTSYLAVLSAISTLKKIGNNIKIGT